jgi:hypothetical protein
MDPQYTSNYSGNIPPEAAAGAFALAGGLFLFLMLVVIAIYVIMAISLMRIAKRTNTENAWFAWIPILNLILMLQVAQRPMWWLIFFLVPVLNIAGIVLQFILWVDIAKRINKPVWMGIFAALIPIVFMPILAFSKD